MSSLYTPPLSGAGIVRLSRGSFDLVHTAGQLSDRMAAIGVENL